MLGFDGAENTGANFKGLGAEVSVVARRPEVLHVKLQI